MKSLICRFVGKTGFADSKNLRDLVDIFRKKAGIFNKRI